MSGKEETLSTARTVLLAQLPSFFLHLMWGMMWSIVRAAHADKYQTVHLYEDISIQGSQDTISVMTVFSPFGRPSGKTKQ